MKFIFIRLLALKFMPIANINRQTVVLDCLRSFDGFKVK